MKIKQFIEKAIKGGWKYRGSNYHFVKLFDKHQVVLEFSGTISEPETVSIEEILLDPLAWQAVGKVEGKGVYCIQCDSYVPLWGQCECDEEENEPNPVKWGQYQMHQMIDALIEGKSIEEFIKTL